jgi:hypothetical protein
LVGAEISTIFSTLRSDSLGSIAWPARSKIVALSAIFTCVSTSELLLSANAGVGSRTRVVLDNGGGSTKTYTTPATSPMTAAAASTRRRRRSVAMVDLKSVSWSLMATPVR